jgi:hypothetical protein
MATPKPPVPPMYGGPLGSLLSIIRNNVGGQAPVSGGDVGAGMTPGVRGGNIAGGISQDLIKQLASMGVRGSDLDYILKSRMTPKPEVAPTPVGSFGDTPEDFGYGGNPVYPTDPYSSTTGQDILGPQPFPGYPQEPVAPSPMPYPSYGDINSYVQGNINDPRAIADAIAKYGVSASDLAGATGYNNDQINQYFSSAGIDPYGQMQKEQAERDAAKMAEMQAPRPEPVANVLPSDMDFMRQNGII